MRFIDLECIIQACKEILKIEYALKDSPNVISKNGFWDIKVWIQSSKDSKGPILYKPNSYRASVQLDNKKSKRIFVHDLFIETIKNCNLDNFKELDSKFQKCETLSPDK